MENKIDIYLVIFFISFILFFVGILVLFAQLKNRQKLAEKEKQMLEQQHIQQLLQARLDMQQQTMQEIGREIHDNVGQKLTLASLYAQQADYDHEQHPEFKAAISSITTVINESLRDLRSLSKSLTSEYFEKEPIKELLTAEIQKIQNTSFRINSSIEDVVIHKPDVKMILVRILQEFIQNTIKYAGASVITLRLEERDKSLFLLLKDDGKGFDGEHNSNGIGLQNMKARVALVGGTIVIRSKPNEGTQLTLFIPKEKL